MIHMRPREILMHFTAISTSLWFGIGAGVAWKPLVRWPRSPAQRVNGTAVL